MAVQGKISDAAKEVNEARDQLADALQAAIPGIGYMDQENLIAALERFANAKARAHV